MVTVEFTSLLQRFFPNLKTEQVQANSVAQLIAELNIKYPGLSSYLIEENGGLRKHVNIFVNGNMIKDREQLLDTLLHHDKVNIIQALSGG